MEQLNKKYYLNIEVLTPLNIGVGAENDWVENVDFVINGKNLYKFNLRALMSDFGKVITDKVGTKGMLSAIGVNNLTNQKYAKAFKLPLDIDGKVVMQSNNPNNNPIKAFIKNNLSGKPIIAGSSLKGAIRSVLFDYFNVKRQGEDVVFGSAKNGDDFMRFVKITDAEFEKTGLVNTKIFNLSSENRRDWEGGWKHKGGKFSETNQNFKSIGFNTIYECIEPLQCGFATIMLSPLAYNNYGKKNQHIADNVKEPIVTKDISFLFDIINKHTKNYLQKEKKFFQTYNEAEYADEIEESIDDLLRLISSDGKSCILKMSAGSGFHSITGDWQFNDYSINGLDTSRSVSRGLFNNRKSAKSRKLADTDDGLKLMGFVKLSLIDEDEYKQNILSKFEKD
jgi:hypothetical protein